MKSHTQKTLVLSFLLASALTMPAIAQTDQPKTDAPSLATPANKDTDQNKVTGKVTAKTDDSLTVDDQTIQVTSSTTLMKSGSPVKIGDLSVGDKVTVSTIKGADGKLLAVTIEVGG